jgi:hypothetical protein
LITAALSLNVAGVRRIPFRSAQLTFEDGHVLDLRRDEVAVAVGNDTRASREGIIEYAAVEFALTTPSGATVPWRGAADLPHDHWMRFRHYLEREIPLRRVAAGLWRDPRSGDVVPMRELYERYSYILPPSFAKEFAEAEVPGVLEKFCAAANVHLIETQRLITKDSSEEVRRPERDVPQRQTVVQYADDLRKRLHSALAVNSRTSQQLDRTFPRRILETQNLNDVDDEAIRRRYEEQSRLRTRLSQIALTDDRTDFPLPDRTLEGWERRVLWTYLEDTSQKLSTFEPLLKRVDALREVINARFLFKNLVIDSDVGFRFITDEGLEVLATSLSSGEQHELILVYDLLFNAPEGSLVLIDEPEISLHVAWQQRVLDDMTRISEITKLRFIVATHSPQIIHKWWSRTVRLAPGADVDSDPDERIVGS